MEASDVERAIAAATAIAAAQHLAATGAVVLHNSNKLALRLTPCDVLARVARDPEAAQLEVDRARQLAVARCPVGVLQPGADPVVQRRDGFAVTLWTYYDPATASIPPAAYAAALVRLHAGMRGLDLRELAPKTPRFTDRVAEAERVVAQPAQSPELTDADREFLSTTLAALRRVIVQRGAPEQLLHGEPHPGNLLSTRSGPLFIDFETICTGPVEFDLAHAPEAVAEHYPGSDRGLLQDCRQLVLAVVAAWRWRLGDEFPDRRRWGQEFIRVLRNGPPWPTLDSMTRAAEQPPA